MIPSSTKDIASMAQVRHYNWIDHLIIGMQGLSQTLGKPAVSARAYPAEKTAENFLTTAEKKHVAGLMRINYAGEVAAQALYSAQALLAQRPALSQLFQQAKQEESDHLHWCYRRLEEVGGRKSYLNFFWYGGAFSLALAVSVLGDQWSLAFLAASEQQVAEHLSDHLTRLPADDSRSAAILQQMRDDEAEHAHSATQYSQQRLPAWATFAMRHAARIMTKTAYWI